METQVTSSEEIDSELIEPRYYRSPNGKELIDFIENLPCNRAMAIKYLYRAGRKDSTLDDLRKAFWYIQREITRVENAEVRQIPVPKS